MKFIVTMLLILISVTAFSAENKTAIPNDFQWHVVDEVKVQFLKPDSWFFRKEDHGNTFAFFCTKEKITDTQGFETGLTVNVIQNIKQDTDAYMERYFETSKLRNPVSNEKHISFDSFKGIQWQITKKYDDGSENTFFNYMISNKSRGTIYMIIFESPFSEWPSAWKIGQVIMKNIKIDEKI